MADQETSQEALHEQSEEESHAEALVNEAAFFAKQDNKALRSVSWSSIPLYQSLLHNQGEGVALLAALLKKAEGGRGLTLACGDMTGEYGFFRNVAKVKTIDAFDVSEGQRDKFFDRKDLDKSIQVNYSIEDVNYVLLPENTYDVIYIQQAYHHLKAIEHVAEQINKALKPDGVFVLLDYIGANCLQRTKKQRELCGELWPLLPPRLRTSAQNRLYDSIHIPKKETLPPFEAIRSEEILPVLTRTFETAYLFTYAGILFPLLEGFAQNYTDSEEDKKLLQHLWDLDRKYIEEGRVEPNFVRAVFTKKKTNLLQKIFGR